MYEIKARVATLGGYSVHADQSGLVEFVTGIREWPEKVVLVHGERRAKVALAEALRSRYDEEGRALLVEIPG
ncbi:RNA-metabolising metallo-beta-lactamase [compost metagenome]